MKSEFLFIGLLTATGCNTLLPEELRSLPPAAPVVLVEKTDYISHTASAVTFETDLHLLYAYGNFEEPLESSFLNFPNNGQYTIISVEKAIVETPANSSVVLLMDQGADYNIDDPFNNRTKAINRFCQFFIQPSEFLIGGFRSNTTADQDVVQFISDDFTSDITPHLTDLFDMSIRTGGPGSLAEALDEGISRLSSQQNPGKRITAMVHSALIDNADAIEAVIARAVLNDVQIDIVSLGSNADSTVLAKIAQHTRGIFAKCRTDKELITTFNALYYLMNYDHEVYRFRIRFVPSAGGLTNGRELNPSIRVTDPIDDLDYGTIIPHIKIPD
jgi:hypothetical protein